MCERRSHKGEGYIKQFNFHNIIIIIIHAIIILYLYVSLGLLRANLFFWTLFICILRLISLYSNLGLFSPYIISFLPYWSYYLILGLVILLFFLLLVYFTACVVKMKTLLKSRLVSRRSMTQANAWHKRTIFTLPHARPKRKTEVVQKKCHHNKLKLKLSFWFIWQLSICYGYRWLLSKRRKPRWGNFWFKLPICVYVGVESGKSITLFLWVLVQGQEEDLDTFVSKVLWFLSTDNTPLIYYSIFSV